MEQNQPTKILIVDDLGSARKILRRLLNSLGYEDKDIEEANDGEEAFAKIQAIDFDLVISDWEMPKLKGIELLQRVRAEKRLENLPFIMITSLNNKETVVAAADHKVSDFIAKPFDGKVLATKIAKVLDKASLA